MEEKFSKIISYINQIVNEMRLNDNEISFESNGISYIGQNTSSMLVRISNNEKPIEDLTPILWMRADNNHFSITCNSSVLRVLENTYSAEERLLDKILLGFIHIEEDKSKVYRFSIKHVDDFIDYIKNVLDDISNNESFKYLLTNDL